MPSPDSQDSLFLLPLLIFILVSGLDDLLLDAAMALRWLHGRNARPEDRPSTEARQRRIAVFIPMWREALVAEKMLEHNLSAIRYRNYDILVGTYPNDRPTQDAIRRAAARFPNVRLAACPHDGPTSKADCLNWIYQQMLLDEQQSGVYYEIVVTHDAEDLIHPDSLRWINHYADRYDMVQIPVLPLPTPAWRFTHGVYCDEFAEYQTRDVPLRPALGGFLPSNGVGTGYTRRALEALARQASNRVFEPECLTEDYENGLRLFRLGFRQIFLPVRLDANTVATREYFPQSFRQAVRQRTRWVMGIALQSWQRHGWGWSPVSAYWFWRDRKGLLGNPLSLLSNLLFVYGLGAWLWSLRTGGEWALAHWFSRPVVSWLLVPAVVLQCVRLSVRGVCSARIYGWPFSLGVPLRAVWANWVNSTATLLAVWRYCLARLRSEPLLWVKTDHLYPSIEALSRHKQRLGEILVASSYIEQADLDRALAAQPPGTRIGEYLVRLGLLAENELYEALSLQQNLPVEAIEPRLLQREAVRLLPSGLMKKWKVLPFRVAEGDLYLAGPEIPSDRLVALLGRHTRLRLRFQLVPPSEFARLERELLR
jgi:adsorption protein B